jgi:predicted cupin superfamily sugar epimerase
MNAEADQLIAHHHLEALPEEGGFFRRTWTSPATVPGSAGRSAGTAILYLMTTDSFSALHRLDADEIWRYQSGDPVQHVRIDPVSGMVQNTILGPNAGAGQETQLVVPNGVWQGARPVVGGSKGWSLVVAATTPGWDPAGFVLGDPASLRARFPGAVSWIRALSR